MTDLAFKTGDTTPGPRVRLVDRTGTPADLTGATVTMQVRGREGIDFAVTIVDAANGVVQLARGDLEANGQSAKRWAFELQVEFSGGQIQTFPEKGYQTVDVWPDLDEQ